jgi:hypothetical protein
LLTYRGCRRPSLYAADPDRIRDSGELKDLDLKRADALCDYLLDIHQVRSNDPGLYLRRTRELVGDGERIMELAGFLSSTPALYRACSEGYRASLCTLAVAPKLQHRSTETFTQGTSSFNPAPYLVSSRPGNGQSGAVSRAVGNLGPKTAGIYPKLYWKSRSSIRGR